MARHGRKAKAKAAPRRAAPRRPQDHAPASSANPNDPLIADFKSFEFTSAPRRTRLSHRRPAAAPTRQRRARRRRPARPPHRAATRARPSPACSPWGGEQGWEGGARVSEGLRPEPARLPARRRKTTRRTSCARHRPFSKCAPLCLSTCHHARARKGPPPVAHEGQDPGLCGAVGGVLARGAVAVLAQHVLRDLGVHGVG